MKCRVNFRHELLPLSLSKRGMSSFSVSLLLTRHFLLVVCEEKEPECENLFPQCLQWNGFSPVWMRSCS